MNYNCSTKPAGLFFETRVPEPRVPALLLLHFLVSSLLAYKPSAGNRASWFVRPYPPLREV
jgi:hypothetical protein